VSLEIRWPGEPEPRKFSGLPKNQAIEIKQFAPDYRMLARHAFRLGGASGR